MDAADDREKQQDELRNALLAAADEEGAAIVEQARRDITLAVRRARRDLHLIRAQLHLCGVEVPPLPLTPSIEQGSSSLGEDVPQNAIVVGRTHALRDVVTEASQELDQLRASVGPPTPTDDVVSDRSEPATPVSPGTRSRRSLVAAGGLAVLVLGVAGWIYSRGDAQSVRLTQPGSPGDAVPRPAPAPPEEGSSPEGPAARAAASPEVLPSRIVVRTVRPVWMRIEVDGRNDVGHEYPEGAVEEFTPTRDLVIRAGDAGAVLLGIGGEPETVMGRAGQVVTRRIAVNEPKATPPPTTADVTRPPDAPPAADPVPVPEAASVTADQQDDEILAKHRRWLDAFVRGDRQALRGLTTEGFSLRDERPALETNSRNASAVQVSDIEVDVAGVGAVLTGRLRTVIDGVAHESELSEVWVRNSQQQWALMGVRITPTAAAPSSR